MLFFVFSLSLVPRAHHVYGGVVGGVLVYFSLRVDPTGGIKPMPTVQLPAATGETGNRRRERPVERGRWAGGVVAGMSEGRVGAGGGDTSGRLRRVSLGLIRNGRDGFNKWLKRHLGARGTARRRRRRGGGGTRVAAIARSVVVASDGRKGEGRGRRASTSRARAARGIEPQR